MSRPGAAKKDQKNHSDIAKAPAPPAATEPAGISFDDSLAGVLSEAGLRNVLPMLGLDASFTGKDLLRMGWIPALASQAGVPWILSIGQTTSVGFIVQTTFPSLVSDSSEDTNLPSWLELYPANALQDFPSNIGPIGLDQQGELERENSSLLLGLGSLAGVLNRGEIEQEGTFNGLAGVGLLAGEVNLGRVDQKGSLNAHVGAGLLIGNVNLGSIRSRGYNGYLGIGLGVGTVNAGSVELEGSSSLAAGAGLLTGLANLGSLQTSNNRDIVAGISANIGLINGLSSFDGDPLGLPSFPDAEIDTKDGDDLVYGGGLYNVIQYIATQAGLNGATTSSLIAALVPAEIREAFDVDLEAMVAWFKERISDVPGLVDSSLGNSSLGIPLELEDAIWGIVNFAKLDTGNGNDTVFGTGDDVFGDLGSWVTERFPNHAGSGIVNGTTGEIKLGSGDDVLNGETWAGKTGADLKAPADFPAAGIVNYGAIDTGEGDDRVVGQDATCDPSNPRPSSVNAGIINNGTITTGEGNDSVNALLGGFRGDGSTDLGLGDDILTGFGSGRFNAGGGVAIGIQKDTLLLANGEYIISFPADADGYFTLSNSGVEMKIQGFELIGSAAAPTTLTNFQLKPATSGENLITVSDSGATITPFVA